MILMPSLAAIRAIPGLLQVFGPVIHPGQNTCMNIINAIIIIIRLDTQGNITFFNKFAQTFFGYREEEIIGQPVIGTIVQAQNSLGNDLAAKIEDIIRHPDRYRSSENENIRRNGERVWVAWTNTTVLDHETNQREILAFGIDRTEQRRAERALVESEARFRTLFESAQDAIFRSTG